MVTHVNKAANEIFVDNDSLIHIVYHGDQTRESLHAVITRAMKMMDRLVDEDKPILVFADIRDMGKHTIAARMTGLRARTIMPFWKMAILTSNSDLYTSKISKMITSMSGRKKEIRYYKTEIGAKKWLVK